MANLMADLGAKLGQEFKSDRTRLMTLETGSTRSGDIVELTGDVTGSTTVAADGSITIATTVADGSHNHVISNVDGLQTALDSKAPLASPTLTGTPTAPTATVGTNTAQLATTAFVKAEIANDAVLKTGATMTGALTSLRETKVAMAANAIDLSIGNFFTKTFRNKYFL